MGGPHPLGLKLVARLNHSALCEVDLNPDDKTQVFNIGAPATNSKWTISLTQPASSYRDVMLVLWWKLAQNPD